MTPGIRVGQTYRDLDRYALNRTIRIDRLDATNAEATILTDGRNPKRIGRHTSVPIANLHTRWELIADTPDWEPVLLDERHEWWGIRHIATGRDVAAISGAPARWTERRLAEEDAAALARDEQPSKSLDMLPTVGDPFRST